MKKLFFLLLPMMAAIWLTTLGGCRKCKGIEGKVLEFGTETPIPNATVTLSDCTGSLGSSLVCTDVATAVTDSKGRFNFKADGFSVAAKAPDYWDTGDDFEMVVNECPKPVLYLYPNASVEITIKNQSGAFRFDASGLANNLSWINLSQNQDTTILLQTKGNSIYTYRYGFQLNPLDVGTWMDAPPLFVEGHKTTQLTINF
jgi:hypothetical protein